MMQLQPFAGPARQRGAAALAVSIILLFGMTLIAFFVNRGMVFEQRTSANQYRSTKAFEMAEAGLEWAVAKLNTESAIAATTATFNCEPSTVAAGNTFARRYLTISTTGIDAVANGRAAAIIAGDGSVVYERCPAPGNDAVWPANTDGQPRFRVEFTRTGVTDPWSIRIISRGCTNAGAACDLASTATPDGVAVVTAVYKMKPALPLAPGAGLVTGGLASLINGSTSIINEDRASNGITVNSGSLVDLGSGVNIYTIAGSSPQGSVLDNDPSLRNLTNADGTGDVMFQSFMGKTFAEYKDDSKVWVITRGTCPASATGRCSTCTGDADCGTKVMDAYTNNRYEKFWADTAATRISFGMADRPATSTANPLRTFGTADRPLIIGSESNIDFSGAITAYGLFYSVTGSATDNYVVVGTGGATVVGAIVTRSDFLKGAGTMNLVYRADLFSPSLDFGTMVRVPGSWRDSLNEL